MRILVTRPAQDAEETARILAARGHQPLLAPLLAIRFLDGPPLALEGVQAVLATSANGVRALARRTPRRDLPLFAVGPQTAAEARALGFGLVRDADGNAEALARATAGWARPGGGSLLHVAGDPGSGPAGSLAAALTAQGFRVVRESLYAVTAVVHMPEPAAVALRQGRMDGALFFSPRSARVFRDCATRDGVPTGALAAFCISPPTAAALAPLAFARILIAERPNQDALLACVEKS